MAFLFLKAPRGALNGSSLKEPPQGLVLMAEETSFSQLHTVHMPPGASKMLREKGTLDGRAGLWKMLSGCRDGSDLFQQTRTRALRRDIALWRDVQGLSRSRTPRIKSLLA